MRTKYSTLFEVSVSIFLVMVFVVGFTSAHNNVVVVPLGSDEVVPVGMVSAFNLDSCPNGWQAEASAEGRTIIGLNPGGTLGGVYGTPYSDLEVREHNHTWSFYDADEKRWRIAPGGGLTPFVDWDNGMDSDGSGYYPLAVDDSQTTDLELKTNMQSDYIPYVQFLMCQKV